MALRRILTYAAILLFCASFGYATIFGTVRGIVHDAQHRPIENASVILRTRLADWTRTAETNADGEFSIDAVPAGEYTVSVEHAGFRTAQQRIVVVSGSAPILHFPMQLGALEEKIEVSAALDPASPESSKTQSVVSRKQIEHTPGASRSNSLAMITDFVPGAYLVHDQLHIRGGHQISWLVDGVPVPNTNIASNVGPQFDPKDIDTIEVQRGGYSAEYGDRTYGVFNVVTRSGFERNREAEVVASVGSFGETNDQLNFGSHTRRFAYYASLNGNRTDLGLETPTPATIHDVGSGFGGFASLLLNATAADQLRLVTSARADSFQIPNTPEQHRDGIRDVQHERDTFVNFSWVHAAGPGMLLTVSPFYHFNRAAFDGGGSDTPLVAQDHRASRYAGGQVSLAVVAGKHNARAGLYGFAQRDDALFGLRATDGSGLSLTQRQRLGGNLEAIFLEDQYKLTRWLTLNGGVRLTHFSGALSENAASPRLGAAIRLPRLGWVLRGYYGRYYQAPPLSTISGPLLGFALQQGFAFLPLHGERDEQHEFGLTIPARGWVLDLDQFRTGARNFFDHDVLANSNIFFPVTLARARIRGWEASLRSPRLAGRVRLHFNYAHQYAEGQGGVTGGLTGFTPPKTDYYFLDHDQRHTLNFGFEVEMPWQSWASGNLAYGSGFLDGDGPGHLPAHTTINIALGKSFGEKWSVQFTALNLTNRRYLLDRSNTFGGTHFNSPRQFAAEVRYRFHY
jgi:outer membrane receptor protein involved in Fe transport